MGNLKRILRKLACRSVDSDEEQGRGKNDSLLGSKNDKSRSSSSSKRPSSRSTSASKRNGSNGNSQYMTEFQNRDLFSIRDYNGKDIDVAASFGPKPKWWAVLVKLVIFLCVGYLAYGELWKTEPTAFFFATFGNWVLVVSFLYLFFSLVGNIKRRDPDDDVKVASPKNLPALWHKITWILFEIAAPAQALATLSFWIFDFDGGYLEGKLLVHGLVPFLVLLEGFSLNRVPVRINHQWFFLAFIYLFSLWSLIHSYTNIGNPMKVNDISLHPLLQWNVTPINAALSTILILFLIAPVTYWFVWMISLFSCPWAFAGRYRRYLNDDN